MAGSFDEAKHPRADDGKFGAGASEVRARAASRIAAKGKEKKTGRAQVAKKIAATVAAKGRAKKTLTKEQEIDKAFAHVARGEHAEAKAIFDKHGVAIPNNVHAMGTSAGFDYSKRAQVTATTPRSIVTVKESGKERLDAARSAEPRPDRDLVDAIGNGAIKDARGHTVALTPMAQSAVREHFMRIAESHGLAPQDLVNSRTLNSMSATDLGGADGSYNMGSGKLLLSERTLAHMGEHAEDYAYDPAAAARGLDIDQHQGRGLMAYNVMVHETVHGTGPRLVLTPSNNATWQLAEELSTEMTARYITATAHGVQPHKLQNGTGYGDVMREAVAHVAEIAGVSHDAAFDAVAKSALAMKRRSGNVDPDAAIHTMGMDALQNLDALSTDRHAALVDKWHGLATAMNKRYPWP